MSVRRNYAIIRTHAEDAEIERDRGKKVYTTVD